MLVSVVGAVRLVRDMWFAGIVAVVDAGAGGGGEGLSGGGRFWDTGGTCWERVEGGRRCWWRVWGSGAGHGGRLGGV